MSRLIQCALSIFTLVHGISCSKVEHTVSTQRLTIDRKAFLSNPPIIDIAPLIDIGSFSDADRTEVQQKILDAANHWGFFQVLNHGISVDLQQDLMGQMQLFFSSPQEVKYTIKRTENNSRGFADDELTKRLKDAKEILDIGQVPYSDLSPEALRNQDLDGVNQWPGAEFTHLAGLKPVSDAYYAACLRLSQTLVRALAQVIPCGNSSYFESAFDRHSSFLRLNYYPVLVDGVDAGTAEPVTDISGTSSELPRRLGVSRHTDAGALTVLFQDPNPLVLSGLEVYSGSKEDAGDGEWVPVIPAPGALTINTGDMMQVWSNGLLKAPEHRVRPTVERSRERYSAPFFYNPNYDAIVTPINYGCASGSGTVDVEGSTTSTDAAATAATDTSSDSESNSNSNSNSNNKLLYAPIRWGDYRNSRFQGDFKDVGEEIQIEHFQA